MGFSIIIIMFHLFIYCVCKYFLTYHFLINYKKTFSVSLAAAEKVRESNTDHLKIPQSDSCDWIGKFSPQIYTRSISNSYQLQNFFCFFFYFYCVVMCLKINSNEKSRQLSNFVLEMFKVHCSTNPLPQLGSKSAGFSG